MRQPIMWAVGPWARPVWLGLGVAAIGVVGLFDGSSAKADDTAGPIASPAATVARAAGRAESLIEVDDPAAGSANGAAAGQPAVARTVAFNFKATPWDAVIDFLSRQTGLPVLREASVPNSTVDFISGSSYTVAEALDITNRLLRPHGLQLRRDAEFLMLTKLADAAALSPSYIDRLPAGVGAAEMATVVIPLNNAAAQPTSDQIRPLLTPNVGTVTPLPQQNMIVIVDIASNIRRVRDIIDRLDLELPNDSQYRLFMIRHARAADVVEALKGLIAVRQQTVIIDKDGKQRVVEDQQIAGLNMQADPRTNSVIAVGPDSRLRIVEELIALIDRPEGADGGDRTMTTFRLANLNAREASGHVGRLFESQRPESRPTLLPIENQGKLTIVGPASQIAQAAALLMELDPGVEPTGGGVNGGDNGVAGVAVETRSVLVPLEHVDADAAIRVAQQLISPRVRAVVRFAPAPAGRAVVVSGPAADVAVFETILAGIDRPPASGREVRQIQLSATMSAEAATRAEELYKRTSDSATHPVDVSVDAESGLLTLVGSARGLDAFAGVLSQVERGLASLRQSRTFELKTATPSGISTRVEAVAQALLRADAPAGWTPPTVLAVDELSQLIVTATQDEFGVIEPLVRSLDRVQASGIGVRVVRARTADPAGAIEGARQLFDAATSGLPASQAGPIDVRYDAASGSLVLVGAEAAVERFARLFEQSQQLAAPARSPRLVDVRQVDAAVLVDQLQMLLESAGPIDPGREAVAPTIEVVASSNSLLVTAEPAQHELIARFVERLDRLEPADLPPLRLFQLRSSDAESVAQILRRQFDRRPPAERVARPVDVQADAATNTLVVSAGEEALAQIRAVVDQLNESRSLDADGREIRIFPLRVARAPDLARVIDEMYPQPPAPVDVRGRVRPDLQPPREIVVRADPVSNSLIVDAPAPRMSEFEQIVRQLDQQQVAGDVELRTYRMRRANIDAAARTLRELAAAKALGATGVAAGSAVTVSTEPTTRTLIVSAPVSAFVEIDRVLSELDSSADRPATSLRLYPLKHARAQRMVGLLDGLLASRLRDMVERDPELAGLPGGVGSLLDLAADAPSNTLVLSAPPDLQLIAAELIAAFDRPDSAVGRRAVRVVPLTSANAGQAAQALRGAMSAMDLPSGLRPGEAGAATVEAVASGNAIVLSGPETDLDELESIAAALDIRPKDETTIEVRAVYLQNTRAEAVTPIVERLVRRDSALDSVPDWARVQLLRDRAFMSGERVSGEIRVAADPGLNAVVLTGPAEMVEVAAQVVASLDVAPSRAGEAGRGLRVIPVENADAGELAQTVLAMLEDDVRSATSASPAVIRVDRASNALVVRADDVQMRIISSLVTELDGVAATGTRQLRTIRLDRSRIDAASLAESVRRLSERRGGGAVEVITIDELLERTARPARRENGVGEGDSESEGSAGGARQRETGERRGMLLDNRTDLLSTIIGLSIASVPEPAGKVAGVLADSGVTIAVDPETNALILLGPPRQADRIAALIRELESQFPPEPTRLRVISLGDTADANAIAGLVNESVRRIGRASDTNPGGSTGAVSVLADSASQSLLVFSNDTDFELVAQVIAATASPASGVGVAVKVYPLLNMSADRAVAAIADMFSTAPRGRQARRLLDLSVEGADGGVFRASFDPSQVRITQSPSGGSVVVTAPPQAMEMIDRLLAVLDQSSSETGSSVRLFPLQSAEAASVSRMLGQVFTASRRGVVRSGGQAPSFIADPRTNTVVVTGVEADLREAADLIAALDVPAAGDDSSVEIIALSRARPSDVLAVIRDVLIGQDAGRRERVRLSARDDAGLLVIRAPKDELEPVRALVASLDRVQGEAEHPVRAVKLERADAEQVARSISDFFDRRSRQAGQRGRGVTASGVSIVGDRRTSTLLISANDADFGKVQELIGVFDAPSPSRDLQIRIVPLANVRVGEIREMLDTLVEAARGPDYWARTWRGGEPPDTLDFSVDDRTNSVILVGQGAGFETMESLIARLDVPTPEGAGRVVRAVRLENANPDAVARALRSATQRTEPRYSWMPPTSSVTVEVDRGSSTLLLIGAAEDVELAANLAADLDSSAGQGPRTIEVFPVRFADASRATDTLRRFFTDRARADGVGRAVGPVFGSGVGSVIIVSAPQDEMALVRDLLAQIDQPEQDAQRRRELFQLTNADARELASAIREQFPAAGMSPEARVVVTAQPSTNVLVVSAPEELFGRVAEMVAQLDAPPTGEDSRLVTVNLASADAEELARTLRDALPPNVKVRITPERRTNALLLTGSEGAITLVMAQIERLDASPARSNVEVRKVPLANAVSYDVFIALRDVVRDLRVSPGDRPPTIADLRTENALLIRATTEQFAAIGAVIEQLDVRADAGRQTEFVPLRFAEADSTARALGVFYGPTSSITTTPGADRVSIIAVPSSNSLIISAGADEWAGIREMLERLDNEEFAGGRLLQVMPLVHADASSVARAITEAFRAPLDLELERLRASQGRPGAAPTQLGEVVVVRAEPLTNSLIVAGSRRDIERIERLVARLDEPGMARLPEAKVVPLGPGRRASTVAASIRQLYADLDSGRGGPKSVVVIGDDSSGTLIVRADDAEFARIRALADSIGDQQDRSLPVVRTLVLKDASAVRLADTIRRSFGPGAAARGQTLAVEIDRSRNALVIASSADIFEEIERVVAELDPGFARAKAESRVTPVAPPQQGDRPAAVPPGEAGDRAVAIEAGFDEALLGGRSVAIAEVTQHTPRRMIELLGQMGVTSADAADRPSVVAEAVRVAAVESRRAVAIIGSPGDAEAVRRLVELLDGGAAPIHGDVASQRVLLIPVRTARAAAVATAINALLRTSDQSSPTPAAQALAEQVRRLVVQRDGVDQSSIGLDLATPIRITPEPVSNTLIVASSASNVGAIRELVPMFDRLPLGEAVVVRFFPLENASATRIAGVVRTLFAEGERLRRMPGSEVRGEPTTQVGRALIGEVALTVDERTNTLIVAGREEGVALVEVLMSELDSGRSTSWIEPRIVQLEHADAVDLAATLRAMLEPGRDTSAESQALRQQVARLRVLDRGGSDGEVRAIEADVFSSLSTLTILPEENINALIVVASRANADAVASLVRMLDVPAAAADSSVRLFPLRHAAADRVATLISGLFDEQLRSGAIRTNDRVVIRPDLRTNTLVVSTSPRSFAMVERLVTELDGDRADPLVGLHVIPVRNADVNLLAPKVQTLMRARIDSARRAGEPASPSDAFSVQAEPAVGALIVAASEENAAMVRELVAMLTGTGPGAEAIAEALAGTGAFDIIAVPTGRASDVAAAARELYADKANRDRGPGSVTVTADQRLNALLVRGTEADVAAIRDLVQRLTSSDPTTVTEIRRIELTRANAADVVALIENVLAGRPISGQARIGSRQAQLLRFLSTRIGDVEGKTTQAEISGAIQEQVTLSAELRTNSIVAVAPPAILELIEAIVNDLDTTQAGERRVEVFRLTNADALDMAQLLRELFNLEQQGNRFVLVPGRSDRAVTEDEDKRFLGEAGLFPVPDSRQQLAITIDSRTNSLLVSATPEYLEEVRQVVAELDAVEANTRDRMVIDLRNARAGQVATTLREYFSAEARVVRETLGPDRAGSLLRLLEQEVTVQGDEQSNSLLVSVSPRYRETVERIVAELDATPPQVLIQVLIAEVTLDDSRTWGLDFNVSPFGGEGYQAGFLAAGAGVATALGVPNLSVGSVDFDLVLRALEEQGRLEVLSRPQILVKDNEPARIQVGENIAIVESVDTFDSGRTQANVTRQDVGIILNVTPSISSDGFVRMDLFPTISSVSTRTTQISEGFQAPIITQRQVETVVTVKDGETIIVGGLIQTNNEERRTKVPLLGDLPIVGGAFKSYEYSRRKTELLVILTPKVIPLGREPASVAKLRDITREEIKRATLPQHTNGLDVFGDVFAPSDVGEEPAPAATKSSEHGDNQPASPVRTRRYRGPLSSGDER